MMLDDEGTERYREAHGLPKDKPAKAICECGRKYRPIYGHAACCFCRKEAAKSPRKHEERKRQRQQENGVCDGSQGATSGDDDKPKKVYPREVQQLFDLISEGPFPCALIHAGGDYRVTWDLDAYHGYEAVRRIVLVCNEHTTIEDIRREVA